MLLGVMDHYAQGLLSQEDAEHTTVYYLRLLGIEAIEANSLVSKPLPKLKHKTHSVLPQRWQRIGKT